VPDGFGIELVTRIKNAFFNSKNGLKRVWFPNKANSESIADNDD
jgi:hypothetical protein